MAKLPLEGIRVIDICVVWAGPYADQLLADYGAEVIKVESIQRFPAATRGILARPPKELLSGMGPLGRGYPDMEPGERPWNRAAFHNVNARNKLSCTMDLTRPKGLEMFKKLIQKSDVFLENNACGYMDKLGVGYPVVSQWNPNLIMLSAPGYGVSGPHKNYVGFGNAIQAKCGYNWLRGYPDSFPGTTSITTWLDPISGAAILFAIVMALRYRKQTGKGQFIEFAQAENLMCTYGEALVDYTMNGRVRQTLGNHHTSAAPHNAYRCTGTDDWIAITVFNDEQWQKLCRAMGEPAWCKDEKFTDSLSRYKNQDELDRNIEAWTSGLDKYWLFHHLQRAGVPAGPLMNERDTFMDPHVRDRKFFEEAYQAECGTHLYPGMAFKMSETPGRIRKGPCRLGEDNEYVYKTILGASDEEYAELEKEEHIGMDYIGL